MLELLHVRARLAPPALRQLTSVNRLEDPTKGQVEFQSKDGAERKGLIETSADKATMRVDTTDLEQGANRPSVRLESTSTYGPGHLFVADIKRMPVGCSVWPAWWSYGEVDYPANGEIDVLEGVNNQSKNQITFWVSFLRLSPRREN